MGFKAAVLKASPALLRSAAAPAPFSAGAPSPLRHKRPRYVQFPSAPLPDASPSSQTFVDANMEETERNLNDSNGTDDASFFSACGLVPKN
jgi:hypothetical protein